MAALLVFLGYAVIGALVLAVAVLLYVRAVASRKVYRCPHCQEIIRVELMTARFCNVCGARLQVQGEDDDD
jgi:rRNA maturation endonuclease Nob1